MEDSAIEQTGSFKCKCYKCLTHNWVLFTIITHRRGGEEMSFPICLLHFQCSFLLLAYGFPPHQHNHHPVLLKCFLVVLLMTLPSLTHTFSLLIIVTRNKYIYIYICYRQTAQPGISRHDQNLRHQAK